jgi:hypothetical protein
MALDWSSVDPRMSDGTHYIGEIYVDSKDLKNVFGMPGEGDKYKVDAEWTVEFSDGVIASIYNYKDGVNYLGRREGLTKTKIKTWHVGGHDKRSLDNVLEAMKYWLDKKIDYDYVD